MTCGKCNREMGEDPGFCPVAPYEGADGRIRDPLDRDAGLCRDCYVAQYRRVYARDPFADA